MSPHPIDREQAFGIWRAGVDAVRADRLVARALARNGNSLTICGVEEPVNGKILVVGAGKAGAGMVAGAEQALGADWLKDRVTGFVNVPADCVRPTQKITLHAARPGGVNEPRPEGVFGAERMLGLLSQMGPDDLCLVLISGGASALLPAPAQGISLDDKLQITRLLSTRGATISELNIVRKQLSRIKGGGLAAAAPAGRIVSLIISDIVGDPLELIGSGPTVPDPSTPEQALEILTRYSVDKSEIPNSVWRQLQLHPKGQIQVRTRANNEQLRASVRNCLIGNNQVAIDAATIEARNRGFVVYVNESWKQGEAAVIGRELADACTGLQSKILPGTQPLCLLSGGEPVVTIPPGKTPGMGGRNQHLALAALERLITLGFVSLLKSETVSSSGIVILSGGTDGEDGPTDAAGALADELVAQRARELHLSPSLFLDSFDSYHFWESTGGLIKTGPTHTNVMDLRVALIGTSPPRGDLA